MKSCKTTDDYEARRFAEDLYYELEGRARRGEAVSVPSFKKVFQSWAAEVEVERAEINAGRRDGDVRRVELWALRYFADWKIDLISENAWSDFIKWRIEQPLRRPAVSTLKYERTIIRRLFRFALRKAFIQRIPDFYIKAAKVNARPDIPEAEWRVLVQYLDARLQGAPDRKRWRERLYLREYILILANTGIRTGEARRLRWRDVSQTRTLSGDVRTVLTVRGKTGEREVVCNVGVEDWVQELRSLRSDEIGDKPSDQEFLFCHPDGSSTLR